MRHAAVLAALILAACTTTQRDITPAFQGTWGAAHIGLRVGTLDTLVEFDCAEGAFSGPYFVNDDGSFEWGGTFTPGTGGPVREGAEPPSEPAAYSGRFNGGEMTLQVRRGNGQLIGPFTLERFREPQLTKCL